MGDLGSWKRGVRRKGRVGRMGGMGSSEKRDVLTRTQQRLWEEYLRLEGDMIRPLYLAGLDAFICEMENAPARRYRPWAADLAEQVVDRGESIPVRMSLFERVLFPALLSGYHERLPGYARWLAGFSHLLYHCRTCAEALDKPPTHIALLRRALEDDPDDALARRRLVEALADNLEYAVHEIPAGILYGQQWASRDECARLRQGLDEFEGLARRANATGEYADLIEECRLHFRAYEDYLNARDAWNRLRGLPGRERARVEGRVVPPGTQHFAFPGFRSRFGHPRRPSPRRRGSRENPQRRLDSCLRRNDGVDTRTGLPHAE